MWYNFIVANIIDEAIIGVGFLLDQGVKIEEQNRVITVIKLNAKISPKLKAVIWTKIDGDCGSNKL